MPTHIALHGVLPALITPLHSDGTFDEDGSRRLVDHVLAGGVHGVLALGSTGEATSFETPVRRRILEVVTEAVGGRVPLLVGVAQTTVNGALEEIRAAHAVGARAALVVPPFYAPIDQPTVLAFYRQLAERSQLPILIYNIPGFTKVAVSPPVVARLAEEGAVAGIKDSSRDFEYFEQVLDAVGDRPDFAAFTGTDTTLLASMVVGAAGAITLSSNLAPAWGVRLYDAIRAGRWDEARQQQRLLLRLVMALRPGLFPTGVKAAMAMLGICGDTPAPPGAPLAGAERARLESDLRRLGLLGGANTVIHTGQNENATTTASGPAHYLREQRGNV